MRNNALLTIVVLFFVFCLAGTSQAVVLAFEDQNNLGVSLGGSMLWNGTGGGHLYMENFADNDLIVFFDANTYVNSFQMNAMPWQGYQPWDLPADWHVDIKAFDQASNNVWSQQVDLQNYQNWSDWYTVNVGVGNISQLVFYATGSVNPWEMGFWPSIDNLEIDGSAPVPEPSTFLLLGAGLAGIGFLRRRAKK